MFGMEGLLTQNALRVTSHKRHTAGLHFSLNNSSPHSSPIFIVTALVPDKCRNETVGTSSPWFSNTAAPCASLQFDVTSHATNISDASLPNTQRLCDGNTSISAKFDIERSLHIFKLLRVGHMLTLSSLTFCEAQYFRYAAHNLQTS
jgi:hypothetical protein